MLIHRKELQRQLEREGLQPVSSALSPARHLLPAAPKPSASPAASPTSLRPDDTMLSEHRTRLCERLLQAACVGQLPAVRRCLAGRAEIDAVAWGGVTALMCAARHGHLEVAKLLLESSADPVRSDMLGRTALDHARHQPAQVTEWLRGHGVMGRQEFERMVQAASKQRFMVILVGLPRDYEV